MLSAAVNVHDVLRSGSVLEDGSKTPGSKSAPGPSFINAFNSFACQNSLHFAFRFQEYKRIIDIPGMSPYLTCIAS